MITWKRFCYLWREQVQIDDVIFFIILLIGLLVTTLFMFTIIHYLSKIVEKL